MFPLDFVVLSNLVKWLGSKLYSKLFLAENSDSENRAINEFEVSCPRDVYYTGTIDEIRDGIAHIDGRYTFITTKLARDVFVGNVVTCVINSNRTGVPSDLTIIEVLNNDYDNLEADQIVKTKAGGVIVKRLDRVFTVSPGPLEFNLDQVITKFIPEVGDSVELIVEKDDDNESRVVQIFPRGYKVISGIVTSYENDSGFINNSIVFQKYHCRPGYQPQIDDHVVLSIVRCQNGSTQFRALHVSPLVNNWGNRNDHDPLIPIHDLISEIIFNPKDVICVTIDEPKIIEAELINGSNTEFQLLKLKAYASESLIELLEPSQFNMSFKPKSKILLKFKVTLKYFGFCSIDFDFIFEDLVFNCSLNLLAIIKENDAVVPKLNLDQKAPVKVLREESESASNNKLKCHESLKGPVPGRHFKARPRFFPAQTGIYEVPTEILTILKHGERSPSVKKDLENYWPCLHEGLKVENYKIFMHCLLYLEEIAQLDNISKLKLTSGFDIRNDFLVLRIEEGTNFSMLQAGDKVIARKPWEAEVDDFEGVIWHAQLRELHIKFDKKFHDNYIPRSEYILTFCLSRTQLRLKHQAVDDASKNLGSKWLFPNITRFSPPFIIRVEDESEETNFGSAYTNRRNTKWNRHGSGYGNRQQKYTIDCVIPVERKRVIKWFNGDLNAEQKCAVVNCLGAETRPYPYIIFGPPGTGKTMTLIELCLQIYKLIPESKILLTAPSNSAADQLSLNLIGSGFIEDIDFVRLAGHRYFTSGNVPDGLVKYISLPVICEEDENEENLPKINRNCLSEKRIIVSTLGSIGMLRTMGFPYGYFSHYIVDEAGQVMEPENLIIACLMSKDSHMILAGDPLQLGPIVFSHHAKRYGLQQSFLMRLMEFKPYLFDNLGFPESYGYNPKFITKLVRSYRALPKLLQLTSQLFYRNELKAMVSELKSKEALVYSKVKEIFPVDSEIPILFHSVSGREMVEDGAYSFYNNEEVFQLCTYLSQLYRLGIQSHQIGIITPYVAQVRKVYHFLDSLNQEVPKIGSVEEFQGQEKDVILLSTVRSSLIVDSKINQLSFIYSPQRINVAVSRAKSVLIIVGNSTTLSNDEVWRQIINYTMIHKSFRR